MQCYSLKAIDHWSIFDEMTLFSYGNVTLISNRHWELFGLFFVFVFLPEMSLHGWIKLIFASSLLKISVLRWFILLPILTSVGWGCSRWIRKSVLQPESPAICGSLPKWLCWILLPWKLKSNLQQELHVSCDISLLSAILPLGIWMYSVLSFG